MKKARATSSSIDSIFVLVELDSNLFKKDQIVKLFMKGLGFTVFRAQEGTVNDIMGSGKLEVIRDDTIRLSIGSWEANLRTIREWEKIERESWNNYKDQLNHCIPVNQLLRDESEAEDLNVENVWEDLYFRNLLHERTRYPTILSEEYEVLLNDIRLLISRINGYLKTG
ncbi:hypothetical protein [Portibacter marinus]|uniref:hypothetical protein n=1 Tax=Portibacter marinus TaxID=2898660 RepID=UPI001F20F283|nr:hypothetical protein [Portibacter marinus]